MERLRKNVGRYHGETIEIDRLTEEIHQLAMALGWHAEAFLDVPGMTLRGYHRQVPNARKGIYLSTGIHGDEPAGPLAMRQLIEENAWPEDVNIWLVPCLNPAGFRVNTRENARGIDLNRDYRHRTQVEVQTHIAWLEKQPPFDVTLILHEDWEANGFYVYELNPEKRISLAEPMIEAMLDVCPVESAALVDDWECRGGIIRPGQHPEDRPQWAEALYLITHKSPQSYTLETPSDYPLPLRVKAHVQAVRTVLKKLNG